MRKIEHFVVLMLENRSFDQTVGCLKQVHTALDGIPSAGSPCQNVGPNGSVFQIVQIDPAVEVKPDPRHDYVAVMNQISGGTNAGFVSDYARHTHNPTKLQNIMSFYDRGQLPALHALGEAFTVCDHWFSSVPGPTWTNRLFALSGTSQGWVKMPILFPPGLYLHPYDQETIFDLIDEREDVSWRIYWDDFSLALLLKKLRDRDRISTHFREFKSNWEDDVAGPADQFPSFVFIEPNYLWPGENDDHPPCSVLKGDALIAHVYNTIRANEELWASTLLVVVFDEHGGFYDHVPPPPAISPDGLNHEGCAFDLYGIRVPAVLASPWIGAGVFPTQLDHTSLLHFLIDNFGLARRRLGARVDKAKTFNSALLVSPRKDTPETIGGGAELAAGVIEDDVPPQQLSDLQESIVQLSKLIEDELMPGFTAMTLDAESALPPEARCELARERMRALVLIPAGSR